MEIYGLEKLSLVDFDGKIASTIFTGTCNFRCGFCHNSPLVLHAKSLPLIDEKEVLDYLESRKNILEGVCISGGEPTLQKDLPLLCEKIKKLGYSVKLDSNGTNPSLIKSLIENKLIDYVAMDIKNDIASYSEIIGLQNFDTTNIEKSVEYLINNSESYEFRTTLVNGYHKEENIKNIAEWLKGAKKYCLQKFKASENCICTGLSAIPETEANYFVQLLKQTIPNIILRGY